MSNLQVLARRCPVMGKAMASQSARSNNAVLSGVFGGSRAYTGKARMHMSRIQRANVEPSVHRDQEDGALMTGHFDPMFISN